MEDSSATKRLSRPEAIERIRVKLKELTDDEHCACSVAGDRGIFCAGFRSLSTGVPRPLLLIAGKRPAASREELEGL